MEDGWSLIVLSIYMRSGMVHQVVRKYHTGKIFAIAAEDSFKEFFDWYRHGNVDIISFKEAERILVLSRSDVGSYDIQPYVPKIIPV